MNLVLCSALEGTLVDKDQKAVPGMKVERSWYWHWTDKGESEQAVTDAQGRFSFPTVRRFGILPAVFPHEPMIDLNVKALGAGEPVLLLATQKHNYKDNGERDDGRPLKVVCRIDKVSEFFDNAFRGTVVEMK